MVWERGMLENIGIKNVSMVMRKVYQKEVSLIKKRKKLRGEK